MNIFVDTSVFVAILDKDDSNHDRTAKIWIDILSSDEALLTTNYVLVETCALVQSRLGVGATKVFQEEIVPVLEIEWINQVTHQVAMERMLSFGRKKVSLVDCVSFATMHRLGVSTALSLDRHFQEQGFLCLPA